jgi:hypothetical protein
MAVDFSKILEGIGLKTESINRIRLGRGVIGKSATVAFGALVIIAIVAARLPSQDDLFLMILAGCGFLLFLLFFVGAMIYGSKNTAAALLEGAELVTWQKQEMAAKYLPQPPITPEISDPKSPLTPISSIEGPDKNV